MTSNKNKNKIKKKNLQIFANSLNISANVFSGLSQAIALSKACFLTTLLHSVYFILASSSFGRFLATFKTIKKNKIKI